eukprot:403339708
MSYTCSQCNQFQNLTNRKPIELNCKCTIICLCCYQNIARNENQNENILSQCCTISIRSGELNVNEMLMGKIESQNSIFITCDNHQTELAIKYCIECQIPVCDYCLYDDHKNHQVVKMLKSQFTSYTNNVMRIFEEYQIESINMKAQHAQQSDNEISMNSIQLKQAISQVTKMLGTYINEEEASQIDPTTLQSSLNTEASLFNKDGLIHIQQFIQDQINQQLKEF